MFSDEISEFRIAPSGMAWKGVDSEGVTAIPNTDIKWAQWMRVARQFQLRVGLKDHNKDKFEGFTREVRACFAAFSIHEWMEIIKITGPRQTRHHPQKPLWNHPRNAREFI